MADEPRTGASGGTWLTYRYRLEGADTPAATGTIKAPSFLVAARRALARGLGATIGPAPAHLRLRAAGEQEVLFRVTQAGVPGADALQLEVVPAGSHAFAADGEPTSAEPADPGSRTTQR